MTADSMTIALELSDSQGLLDRYGAYIQGESRLHICVRPEGSGQESPRISVDCGGVTAQGQDLVFALPNAGTVPITVTAVFSDGSVRTRETAVSVLPYSPPRVNIRRVERADAQGQPDNQGNLGLVTLESSISDLPGGNEPVYSLQFRPVGTQDWQNIVLSGLPGGSLSEAHALFPAERNADFEVRARVQDSLHLRPGNLVRLSVAFALADFSRETRSIGLGCRAARTDTLSIGLNTSLGGNRLAGLPDPLADDEAVGLGFLKNSVWMPRLLWENPAPEESFPARSVTLDLSEVNFIAIAFHSGQEEYMQLFPKGSGGRLFAPHESVLESRPIRSGSSGISFFAAEDNSRLIPTRIYGL